MISSSSPRLRVHHHLDSESVAETPQHVDRRLCHAHLVVVVVVVVIVEAVAVVAEERTWATFTRHTQGPENLLR